MAFVRNPESQGKPLGSCSEDSGTSFGGGRISVHEVVIHLTLRCPLECSHCCVRSDPSKKGHLELEQVLQLIEEASQVKSVDTISFVGGEPFLHREIIEEATRRAVEKGLRTGITTSGFWATAIDKALQLLRPLAVAGLTTITFSYDDPHAEYVSQQNIVNGARAAMNLGIRTFIAVVVEPGARINAAYMRQLFGEHSYDDKLLRIYETAVTSTGRAADEASESRRQARRQSPLVYRGPCLSILRQFSVHSNGRILPCCGVIPSQPLELMLSNENQHNLADAIRDAYDSPVFRWIAFEGPIAILKRLTAETDHPLRDEDFDGVCNACDLLFSSPLYRKLLTEFIPLKEPSLEFQECLYSELGLFERPDAKVEKNRSRPRTDFIPVSEVK